MIIIQQTLNSFFLILEIVEKYFSYIIMLMR